MNYLFIYSVYFYEWHCLFIWMHMLFFNLIFLFIILFLSVAASEGRSWNSDIAKNNSQEMTTLRSSLINNNTHQDQIGNFFLENFLRTFHVVGSFIAVL